MSLVFTGPPAYVADLARSRTFYEELLGLTVARVMSRADRPIAVAYTAGLSIWLASDAYLAIFPESRSVPPILAGDNWENTFETDDYEVIYERLRQAGASFVYPPRALPWGQLGFRVRDPDGHILDISETHRALARRLAAAGQPLAAIAAQLSMSEATIAGYLAVPE